MYKKDYELIAAAIKACPFTAPYDKHQIVTRMAHVLSKDNKRFDEDKFIAACYPKN